MVSAERANGDRSVVPRELSVFDSDPWLEWNARTWRLAPERVVIGGSATTRPRIEGVVYRDRRGRVRRPNLNGFLPFHFLPTDTKRLESLDSQWLATAGALADRIKEWGLVGGFSLPPHLEDARPFRWKGFATSTGYTYATDLPLLETQVDKRTRNRVRHATALGYTVSRTEDWSSVMTCLAATEAAGGFSHRIGVDDLGAASRLLGPDALRAYEVRSPDGRPASCVVILHRSGGTDLGWIGGTVREHLPNGANQLLHWHAFEDIHRDGAVSFDFLGANIQAIAGAKASWGFPLRPCIGIAAPDVEYFARSAVVAGRWLRDRARSRARTGV